MTTHSDQRQSLDDVLAAIAALPTPPDAQALRIWMIEYPDFKSSIVAFVTDWIEAEASKSLLINMDDDVNSVVNRTMSRVQQLLDQPQRSAAINDLTADIAAAGHSLDSFQRAVGIDRTILSCLAGRMVRPATIPLRLVIAMAEALQRGIDHVRDFLRMPLAPEAAYKSRKRPTNTQMDFRALVQAADLSEHDKRRWHAEAPDPELQD